MRLENCHEGMRVKYVPTSARRDPDHKDCKNGVIESVGDYFVTVNYDDGGRGTVGPSLLVSLRGRNGSTS